MENKQNILVIGPRGLYGHEGGIEKFADEFVPRTLKVANVSIICLKKPDVEVPDNLEIIVTPKSKRFKTDKALILLYAPYLYATRRFDHVFIFGTNFALLIPLLKAVFWRRAKIHLRSGSVDHILPKWGKAMRYFMRSSEKLCKYADTVIAVAPSIQKHLKSLSIPAVLVRNGLDKKEGAQETEQRTANTIVAIGRVTTQKNYPVLVEASHLLGAGGPEITVIGGADLTDESHKLKQLLNEKAEANINFAGIQHRTEVLKALKSTALYINCSVHEGMSNAVLEAIQQGIPLILSDIDANRDLALDDRYYFDPHDAKALADKIKDALANPESYKVSPDLFENWDQAVGRILKVTGVTS